MKVMVKNRINPVEKFLMTITWFFSGRDKKNINSKYENFTGQAKSNSDEKTIDRSIILNNHTVENLLQKLDKFEKSKKFLKKDISLTYLASSLETNPRYLSEIIKQFREKNFNNYINGLRINHIIEKLYDEPIYREYKIIYLARYCGFASREVFAIAFKKEKGVTPSCFIDKLKNEKN